jgi:ATP adenylyltransferase
MKNLWAPWRMSYIEAESDPKTRPTKTEGCIFCRFPKESADRDNLILKRKDRVYVIMNRYPYSNGHLLVVPYAHVKDPTELPPEARAELFETATELFAVLRKTLNADGFNMGVNLGRCAGAGIEDHVHVHLVPRWSGDTNFMPVLAESKVISEHILATYDKLAANLERA